MKKYSIWLTILAFMISLVFVNSGESAIVVLFINPFLWIPAYLMDDSTTEIYKLYTEYLPAIAVTTTTLLYLFIGLIIDNKLIIKDKF